MFENRNCAHCLFGKYDVNTWSPDGLNRGYNCTFQCQRTGRQMREEDTPKNSCWRFARNNGFLSKDEQIRNLLRNKIPRHWKEITTTATLIVTVIGLLHAFGFI